MRQAGGPLLLMSVLVMLTAPASVVGQEQPVAAGIEEVKSRHTAALMALPGVVSVGIGRDDRQQPVIVVGIDRADRTPGIPGTLQGYRVVTRVIGPVKAR